MEIAYNLVWLVSLSSPTTLQKIPPYRVPRLSSKCKIFRLPKIRTPLQKKHTASCLQSKCKIRRWQQKKKDAASNRQSSSLSNPHEVLTTLLLSATLTVVRRVGSAVALTTITTITTTTWVKMEVVAETGAAIVATAAVAEMEAAIVVIVAAAEMEAAIVVEIVTVEIVTAEIATVEIVTAEIVTAEIVIVEIVGYVTVINTVETVMATNTVVVNGKIVNTTAEFVIVTVENVIVEIATVGVATVEIVIVIKLGTRQIDQTNKWVTLKRNKNISKIIRHCDCDGDCDCGDCDGDGYDGGDNGVAIVVMTVGLAIVTVKLKLEIGRCRRRQHSRKSRLIQCRKSSPQQLNTYCYQIIFSRLSLKCKTFRLPKIQRPPQKYKHAASCFQSKCKIRSNPHEVLTTLLLSATFTVIRVGSAVTLTNIITTTTTWGKMEIAAEVGAAIVAAATVSAIVVIVAAATEIVTAVAEMVTVIVEIVTAIVEIVTVGVVIVEIVIVGRPADLESVQSSLLFSIIAGAPATRMGLLVSTSVSGNAPNSSIQASVPFDTELDDDLLSTRNPEPEEERIHRRQETVIGEQPTITSKAKKKKDVDGNRQLSLLNNLREQTIQVVMLVINLIMMRQMPVPAGTVATVMEIVIVEIVTVVTMAVIVAIMTVGMAIVAMPVGAAIVAVTVGAAIVIDKIETVEIGVIPSATFNVMEQQYVFYNKASTTAEFVIVPVEFVIAEIAAVGIVTADNVTVETVITDIVILTVMFSLFVPSEQGRW
ncbi:hypothetical protein GEV33_012292 [Tenebrio molitor]|uniref:Uncharacterized protein n=1 Tax=Tenebrio molitor TaxID=7067 RepID=A0A8J6L961_TENMO|nr:hypothetical protein GEV33_012292 [Tenebrio molitor]